jgi:hypothetical protein
VTRTLVEGPPSPGWCRVGQRQSPLAFCKQVATAYPRRQLRIVLDNYGTHKHPKVRAWLARNPRIHLHFTPTSASWMSLVEIVFGIITPQGDPPGHLHQRHRPGPGDPDLHRRLEPALPAIPVDQTPEQILAKAMP